MYLSSEVVYGRSYSSDIHETEPASSKSFQAMAILQGENICKSYRDTRFDKQLQSFGADLKSYLEYAHLSIEDMRKDYEQAAQRQLKSQYVMMAIIDAEKLEPTDEDFREVIAMSDTAKQQHWDDEKIDAELKDNRMKYAVSALYNAAVKMLVANAVVPAAAPAEEAPAAE